ncbi:hypothetical protein [Actinomadura algeriensis]|uniref:Enzyme related to lactoylglutathione lyase n=1 Tax=Actinomadura algeriensis TaxID=1679523 RepID=A0ABR9JZ21_9ACTN|nr:hypothetical protein [Actinomadura algeriensis]MBE1535591.1 putative enzyme related to lactoylglutathione lyase [Actinomadura algeriensis]
MNQDAPLSLLLVVVLPALTAAVIVLMRAMGPLSASLQQRIDRVNRVVREQSHRPAGHLEVRAAEFGYRGAEEPVLRGVSMIARPGETTAIVGSTGAGGHRIGTVSDLTDPIYPAGTPPHIAYYLRADEVDRRVQTAVDNGARLVLAPFDAGDQGRIATLLDPLGAHFSLWQTTGSGGWDLPDSAACTPLRMVLACDDPERARCSYRERLGLALVRAGFVAASSHSTPPPRWELVIGADDLGPIAARALDHGSGPARYEGLDGRIMRLRSPEGLPFQVQSGTGPAERRT